MCRNPGLGANMDIVVWLRSLGLGQYEAAFRENEIDETVLPSLTSEDLKEVGVGALGHRRKLLGAIAGLRGDTNTSPVPTAGRAAVDTSPRDTCRAPPSPRIDVFGPCWFDGA